MRRVLLTLLGFACFFSRGALAARSVTVTWEAISGASRYELQIAGEGTSFSSGIVQTGRSWSGELPEGKFIYRVRAIDSKGNTGRWTSPVMLTLTSFQRFRLGVGLGAGFNYIFPVLHFEAALGPRWGLGLVPVFLSQIEDYTRIQVLGGFLALSYAFSEPFDGKLGMETGVGAYSISESYLSRHTTPFALYEMACFRQEVVPNIEAALAVGAQYIFPSALSGSDSWVVRFSGLLPLVLARVDYRF